MKLQKKTGSKIVKTAIWGLPSGGEKQFIETVKNKHEPSLAYQKEKKKKENEKKKWMKVASTE